jgi:hypothetical protein
MSQRQLRSKRRGDPPASSTPAQPTPAPPTSTTSSRERGSTSSRNTPTKSTSALSMESASRNTPTPSNPNGESTTNNSPTPTRTNSRAGSPKPTLYKYTFKNIPPEFAGQKKFHTLLTTHLLVRNINKLVVNWNKTAFLITSLPLHDKFAQNLIAATGSKTISCCPLKRKTEAPNNTGNNCVPQQTRVPQMPPNPRAEQMRSRHFNLPPLRRSPRRVVAFVSLHKNRPNYGSNADRPHNRDEPPRGNRGPGHHAERTRRTHNQREANNRVRHQNLVRLVPPTAPQNSRVDRTHRVQNFEHQNAHQPHWTANLFHF